MSCCQSKSGRRFYRNRDRALVAGVCAGLADYFGFNLRVTRLLAIISLIVATPVTLIIYFATVCLVPAASDPARPSVTREDYAEPRRTLGDVKERFHSLDTRLARLERYVTSSRFDLDRELRNL